MRSDLRGLAHLAGHFGAIAVCTTLIAMRVPFWPILLPVQGILLVFLFTLLHETSHKTPFKSPAINDIVGHICGFILLIPARWFQYFHLAHHRHTQVLGKDPELETAKPETWPEYVLHVSGLPVWLGQVRTLLQNAIGQSDAAYIPTNQRKAIKTEARLYLLAYAPLIAASILTQSFLLIMFWILPMVMGQPFLRLYLLAEHGRCAFVANMFENTRTTFTNRIVRALAWNMPYHTEHHSYPAVPFHQLPALHEAMKEHLIETSAGYGAFNREYARRMRD